MPNINSLLAQSIIEYRRGRCLPVPLTDHNQRNSTWKLMQLYMNKLSAADQQTYQLFMHLIGLAANLCNQALYADARNVLKRAADYMQKNTASDMLQIFCRARIAQAESELEFQLENYQNVQERILKSLHNDHLLEQKYEITFLHSSRLLQILLWIQASIEMKAELQAVLLAQETVFYLMGDGKKPSIGKGWSRTLVEVIPKHTRHALLAQFASVVGCLLSRKSGEQAGMLFSHFSAWKCFDGHECLQEIYTWGKLKKAYLRQDYRMFLTGCIPFLKSGRRETLLWDTTVLDLCRCCKVLRPLQTVGFLEDVSEHTSQMWDIPPGGYSLPTEFYYKRIFVIKEHSFAAFVLPANLRRQLESVVAVPINIIKAPEESLRRFHAYNVGLPRSGCSSIMALFGNYRSVAEYKERESVELITANKDGWIPEETLREYIRRRHKIGQLEMDTASFNHFYLHILIEEFPQAKFIFTIRDCYTWVNSFLKMISRWKKHFLDIGQDMPDWMLNYGRILFGEYNWQWFNSYEDVKENLHPLVEMFIKSWAHYNLRILDLLPPERSIIIKTSEISRSQEKLAGFIGVPAGSITGTHHINSAPDTINLLEEYDMDKFNELCFSYGRSVLKWIS